MIIHEDSKDCNKLDEKEIKCFTENTGEVLVDKASSGKEKPWGRYKVENKQLVELFEILKDKDENIISDSRFNDLKECASFLVFARDAGQKQKLKKANFCRFRLCPMCNWRRSLKLFSQVNEIASNILVTAPTTRFLFLTLTVKNCTAADLSDTLDNMNKAFTYITGKTKTFAPAKQLKTTLLGYMKAIEITYDSQKKITKEMYKNRKEYYKKQGLKAGSDNPNFNTYHPHIHVLLAVKPSYFSHGYIKNSEYKSIWKKALKVDYEPKVNIQTIKNSTSKAVAEVAKYPVKTSDLINIDDKNCAAEAVRVLYESMKGRRLVSFGGIFNDVRKKLNLENVDSENIDLLNVDKDKEKINAIELVLYKFHAKTGCYIC